MNEVWPLYAARWMGKRPCRSARLTKKHTISLSYFCFSFLFFSFCHCIIFVVLYLGPQHLDERGVAIVCGKVDGEAALPVREIDARVVADQARAGVDVACERGGE